MKSTRKKKLNLKKVTISSLEQKSVRGGGVTTIVITTTLPVGSLYTCYVAETCYWTLPEDGGSCEGGC